jgi:hypothetical protein
MGATGLLPNGGTRASPQTKRPARKWRTDRTDGRPMMIDYRSCRGLCSRLRNLTIPGFSSGQRANAIVTTSKRSRRTPRRFPRTTRHEPDPAGPLAAADHANRRPKEPTYRAVLRRPEASSCRPRFFRGLRRRDRARGRLSQSSGGRSGTWSASSGMLPVSDWRNVTIEAALSSSRVTPS